MKRFFKLLGVTVGAAVLLGVVLVYAFDMRVAMDGSAMWPVVSFGSRSAHFDALDRHRASQAPATPRPASAPSAAESASPTTTPPSGETPVASAPATIKTAPPAAASRDATSDWPGFRGPNRDGVYRGAPLRDTWPTTLQPVWKQPVGEGYASFAVADGRAFTIEQRRGKEVVAAYDVEDGRELWTNAWDGLFTEGMGGDGPRATPAWDQGRVYALGGTGELRCLDARTGTVMWRHNILSENGASNLPWGMAASPLVVDDKVIVLPGGPGGRSVVAYHKESGAPMWAAQNDTQAYAAPMVTTLAGRRQLVVVSADRVLGLRVEDGRLLWSYPWATNQGINAAQPIVVGANRLFVSSGYGHGSVMLELSPDGADIQPRAVWENTRMKNKFSSSVLYQGHIYGLDEAILACLDASTGELKWKGGRYGYGQLVLAGDKLIVLTEHGELVLVKASPAGHQELSSVVAIDGKTWNHPALAGGRLLVRNAREMAAFDLRSAVPGTATPSR